ncbi:hypothetical protein CLCR_09991 [Cladophialophora carrionii]|uniref:Wax synthase domain-containing protein n=1 Tax=Cladophialophora carrionii TaxID=86049 RepID=A0A1C1CXI9_9EURO|nr:hypothetical protein CLCR_09991 [Cladophialophora carrionii]
MAQENYSLYRQTLLSRQHRYDASVRLGKYTPFLYPWDTLPALYLFLAISITPRLPLSVARAARYIAFILVLLHGAYVVSHRRTLWFAGGYGIGLSSAWGIIMSGAVLVCNDLERDFKRLETRVLSSRPGNHQENGSATHPTSSYTGKPVDIVRRSTTRVYSPADPKHRSSDILEQPATRPYRLVWQGFPYGDGMLHLIDWTVDLMTSFRGVGWKHRISTANSIEAPIQPERAEEEPRRRSPEESKPTSISTQNLRSLQMRAVQDFMVNYLLLDLLKTMFITDAYFLGLAPLESPSPWHWLSRLNETLPIATRLVRLSLSMAGVIVALSFIFSLNPLFFATILPRLIDISKLTKAPLLEPSLYPRMWYPLTTSVMYSGLAGFWGKFWHQMFRFGISEPSRVLVKKLRLNPRGNVARAMQVLIAFGLSGTIHALGSHSTFSLQRSHPLSGPLLFFLLQALGIFLQTSVVKLANTRLSWVRATPLAVRQTINLIFVLTWLYFTGPLLANDFARCGIWLFEPVPISPLRGLGFGPGGKDEGWWTWYQEGSRLTGLWKGEKWWERALAIY